MAFPVRWSAGDAAPVRVGDLTVTARSHALVVGGPRGGFVWQFPTSVQVEERGDVRRVPIVDVTGLLWLGLVSLTLIGMGVGLRPARRAA
jgi:hypothetical protein